MNTKETLALLTLAAQYDSRMLPAAPHDQAARAQAWQPLLAMVDAQHAAEAVRGYYASPAAGELKPGMLRLLALDVQRAARPSHRQGTCTHSDHTICQACDATAIARYNDQHPPPKLEQREFPPQGGGHRFRSEDGHYCDTCGLPEKNRRHLAVI